MIYKKGDRIKHPKMEKWGVGVVLEDSTSNMVRIFFSEVGEKTLSLDNVQPIKLTGDEENCPLLDNILITPLDDKVEYQSPQKSIDIFITNFPHGFYDPKYLAEERDYKIKAHQLAIDLLAKSKLEVLLQKGDHETFCKQALRVVNATNLIFPNEKMSLKDGLTAEKDQRDFCNTLYELLHGTGEFEYRFTGFIRTLDEIGAGKWTVASYFMFTMQPNHHIFIKPTVTQHVAKIFRQEINYKPNLNWLTYRSILNFSEIIKNEICDLKPRDMIDVQSFMWSIVPRNY